MSVIIESIFQSISKKDKNSKCKIEQGTMWNELFSDHNSSFSSLSCASSPASPMQLLCFPSALHVSLKKDQSLLYIILIVFLFYLLVIRLDLQSYFVSCQVLELKLFNQRFKIFLYLIMLFNYFIFLAQMVKFVYCILQNLKI